MVEMQVTSLCCNFDDVVVKQINAIDIPVQAQQTCVLQYKYMDDEHILESMQSAILDIAGASIELGLPTTMSVPFKFASAIYDLFAIAAATNYCFKI